MGLGQFTLEDLDDINVPKGEFETTLTRVGIEQVEWRQRREKFNIFIPGGID